MLADGNLIAVIGNELVGDWEDILELEADLNEIVLSDPPSASEIPHAVVQMDELSARLFPIWTRAKILLDNIEDLIDEVLKSTAVGSNPDSRRAASYAAARSYDVGGIRINLFEARRYARSRFQSLDSIMKALERKHARLVTLEGAYKVEAQLASA